MNLNKEDFGAFVKTEISNIPPILDEKMASYKYL